MPKLPQLELPLAPRPAEAAPLLTKEVQGACQTLLAQVMKDVLRAERKREAGDD